MKRFSMLLATGLILATFSSCQKDDSSTVAVDEVTLTQQETQSEEIMNDVDLLVDEAIDTNASGLKSATTLGLAYLNDCPVITVNTEVSPEVLTIDFGTACTGEDGKVRSGKIIVTSASFKTFPSIRTKTFENFYVDGKKVVGEVIKTISKDQENNIRTAEINEDVTITFANGEGTAQRTANITRQYDRGERLIRLDNQLVIWGTAEFTRINGVKITKTISQDNPLIFRNACHHIVSGIVSVTTTNNRDWTIDYGSGTCDNIATLTINGKSREIRLK
jgi:hypothetical protein